MNSSRRKSQLALSALLAVGAYAPASPVDEPGWPEGVYGNVDLSEQTGDLGGFEVLFYTDNGKRMAEFVLCEGWCNRAYRAEVMRNGDAFRFSHVEERYVHGEDGLTRFDGPLVEYSVKPTGNDLIYNQTYDGESVNLDPDAALLMPLKEPFGLAVANGEA